MQEEFYRIKRLPPYVFAEVNALKARARAEVRIALVENRQRLRQAVRNIKAFLGEQQRGADAPEAPAQTEFAARG